LRELADSADRAVADLRPLLIAEHHRLTAALEVAQAEYLSRTLPQATAALRQRLTGGARRGRPRRTVALDLAHDVARGYLDPWCAMAQQQAEQAYRLVAGRFAELGRTLIARLVAAAGIPGDALDMEVLAVAGMSAPQRFAFTGRTSYHYPVVPWASWLADAVLPPTWATRRIHEAAIRYVTDLLSVNAERLKNDLDQRVLESRRELEWRLRRTLDEVSRLAMEALGRARQAREAGLDAVAAERAQVEQALAELDALLRATA
jgi:hypothetical protein